MGVFHVLLIVQMLPNRATHHNLVPYLDNASEEAISEIAKLRSNIKQFQNI